ncbi:MAG: hypothetical protein JO079_13485 [Frankiaceae bacterium]|nr:hypothetical protein [Frankiaceae bacterium]
MRRALGTATAAAALAATALVTAAPANAATDTIHGGCLYDTEAQQSLTSGTYVGVIWEASVTQERDTIPTGDVPTGATVYCRIVVNGVVAPNTTFAYPGPGGVQAGANQISFAATASDTVWLDERVVYADGTDTGWGFLCRTCQFTFPPEDWWEDVQLVTAAVNGAFVSQIDPRVCPILAAHPGTYGAITIEPDGDVYAADPAGWGLNPVYDCLPYGNAWP